MLWTDWLRQRVGLYIKPVQARRLYNRVQELRDTRGLSRSALRYCLRAHLHFPSAHCDAPFQVQQGETHRKWL